MKFALLAKQLIIVYMSEKAPGAGGTLEREQDNAFENFEPSRVAQRKKERDPYKAEKAQQDAEAQKKAWEALQKHEISDELTKRAIEHLLEEAAESITKGKAHLEGEKKTIGKEAENIKKELEKVTEAYNKAVIDSGDKTKGNLFEAGKMFTSAKNEKERLEKLYKTATDKQEEIDEGIKNIKEAETKLSEANSKVSTGDLAGAKEATTKVMTELEHAAHGISHRSTHEDHGHAAPSFWDKLKGSLSQSHWVAGAGVMGAITWYLGIVWGEVTGGWKSLGGGSKKSSGGGHGGGHH